MTVEDFVLIIESLARVKIRFIVRAGQIIYWAKEDE